MTDERDVRVGQNLIKHRGIHSQQSLAKVMRARGWKWSQATVWAIEKGERPLKFLEAVDLADYLGIRTDDLLQATTLATVARSVADRVRHVQTLAERMADTLVTYERERRALEDALDAAAAVRGWDRLADTVEIGRALSYDTETLVDFARATAEHELTSLFHAGHPDRLPQFLIGEELEPFDPDRWRADRDIALKDPPPNTQQEGEPDGVDQEAP